MDKLRVGLYTENRSGFQPSFPDLSVPTPSVFGNGQPCCCIHVLTCREHQLYVCCDVYVSTFLFSGRILCVWACAAEAGPPLWSPSNTGFYSPPLCPTSLHLILRMWRSCTRATYQSSRLCPCWTPPARTSKPTTSTPEGLAIVLKNWCIPIGGVPLATALSAPPSVPLALAARTE